MQYLLEQGASPDGDIRHANTLLYNAVLQGNIPAVKVTTAVMNSIG